MKKLPLLALLGMPYLVLALVMRQGLSAACLELTAGIFAGVVLLNFVWARWAGRLGFSARQLAFWAMLLKICHIPFYLLVFAVGVLLNVMIIPLLPFMAFMDYLLLLSTSLYGIRALWAGRRQGSLSLTATGVCTALQLLFCLDLAGAIWGWVRLRKADYSSSRRQPETKN